MARRSRNSEVLLTGDTIDNRARFQTRDRPPGKLVVDEEEKPADDSVEFFVPEGDDHHYKKTDDAPAHAAKRLRRQPKVIDVRQNIPEPKVWKDDAPQGDHPCAPAEWTEPEPKNPTAKIETPTPKATPDLPPPGPEKPAKPAADIAKPKTEPKPTPKAEKPPAAPAKPKPKKSAAKAKKPLTPKQSSGAVAKTMVNSMVGRLRAEAERKGSITVADLDAMQVHFNQQAEKLGQVLEKSFESFIEARDRAEWGLKRDLPFDRIIVKSFSELFLEQDYSRFDRVSRRMLPGFFMALNMMLGEELVDEYQEQCQLVVERLRREMGDSFEWDSVYETRDAKALMLDAAITIATYFGDYERRSNWFIELINGHLGGLEGAPKEEAGWEMTPASFKRFLDHLFAELRAELATDSGKLRITKRHGADTCANIYEILEEIET